MTMNRLMNHPDFYCHSEVFSRRDKDPKFQKEFLKHHTISDRHSNPVPFAYRVLDYSPGPSFVGFKMWLDQSVPACLTLLADPRIYKVILERENCLASYSSTAIADARKEANSLANVSMPLPSGSGQVQVAFNRTAFLNHVYSRELTFNTYRQKAAGPVLDTTYVTQVETKASDIVEFLGAKQFEMKTRFSRINSTVTIDRFLPEYHEEIRTVLGEIGHPEWESE